MRTHDPNWEPDPNIKYNFKAKKRKVAEEDDRELEESVRTISALFQSGGDAILPDDVAFTAADDPVADIRAEIAAAIAQAHSHIYDDDEDEEGDVESGQDVAVPAIIGPNTSGIRGEDELVNGDVAPRSQVEPLQEIEMVLNDEAEDSDAFPIPLRTRRTKESAPVIGTKRKR